MHEKTDLRSSATGSCYGGEGVTVGQLRLKKCADQLSRPEDRADAGSVAAFYFELYQHFARTDLCTQGDD